jgi:hypothetical protein
LLEGLSVREGPGNVSGVFMDVAPDLALWLLMTTRRRIRTLRGWATSLLQEAGASSALVEGTNPQSCG